MAQRIELRQLKYFLLVSQQLSFTRAAHLSGVTQSALSQQIARLEDLLGTALLERTRQSVQLTAAGDVLLSHVEDILNQVDDAAAAARLAGQNKRDKLVVGYATIAIQSGMTAYLDLLRKRRPRVDQILQSSWSQDLEIKLANREIDCAFIASPTHRPDFRLIEIGWNDLILCLPIAHPLATKPIVDIRDVAAETLILFSEERATSTHRLLQKAFDAVGIRPIIRREGDINNLMMRSATGEGITFVPRTFASGALPGVVLKDISPNISVPIAFAWRRADTNPGVNALAAIIRSQVRQATRD